MKVLEDIKELIEEELKAMKKKGSLSPAELDSIHKAVVTIKYIDEICEKDEEGEMDEKGYSGKRMMRYSGNYSGTYPFAYPATTPVYYPENSYSGRYDNRNTRYNRYSGYMRNDNWSDNSYQGYRSDHGYGYSREGAATHLVDRIKDMLNDACTDKEQAAIYQCLDRLTRE